MRQPNLKRPKVKGTRRPYMPPPKVTQAQKSIKNFMRRIRRGAR